MSATVLLEPAPPSSANTLAEMSRDLVEFGLHWRWRPPRVLRHMADPNCEVVRAKLLDGHATDRPKTAKAGPTIGFVVAQLDFEQAHLVLLAVAPEHRRLGVGRKLVAWIESMATVAGCEQIALEARASQPGTRAFYRALGYREVDVVPGYYEGVEAAVRLVRDLRVR